ncbi:MAG: ribosome maturation factor RimM [Treponema sp.]|nr:ribosome maturation factor RimM [Treponema sp.]
MTDKFVIGLVGAPFGVKGFVKIHSCSGEIEHLLKLQSVVISQDGKERELKIEESTPYPPAVLMRFAGINSPEAAKTLNRAQLIANREQAAPLKDGEFYIEDLKGLPVLTADSEVIGAITDIIDGGGGELVEVKLNSGEKRLIPFRKEFITEINPEKGKAVLQNLWILE